ncbi:hypothetical protein GYMLUDRAFT_137025, partial [Collybiopsis luxurians FD-317 M1]
LDWPISNSAWYAADAGFSISRNKCSANTRKNILKTIQNWVYDKSNNGPPIFWLTGMAGMGKSTIAYSICNHFDNADEEHHLGASFFCSRQTESLCARRYIIPTIAQQLATYSVAFLDALSGIKSQSYVVEKQIDELLLQPWQRSWKKQLAERLPVLVVIDALDEIEDGEGAKFMGALITSLIHAGPNVHGIKFLVTSRPDPRIISICKKMKFEVTYRLEDVSRAEAIEDVRKFLGAELPRLDEKDAASLDMIAQQSQGLFIYASTALRYICPKELELSSKQIHARLTAIASDSPSHSHLGNTELLVDTFYKQIVNEALGERGTDVFELRRKVLDTIAIAQQPISVSTVSQLVADNDTDSDLEAVEYMIGALYAVAYISKKDGCVYIYHKSFLDFLLDSKRAGEQLVCNAPLQHGVIAKQCFKIMNSLLEFNMSKLPSSFLLDCEIQDLNTEIAVRFDQTLRYCCLSWVDHWVEGLDSTDGNSLVHLLHKFGEIKVIFWIEGMNLLRTGRKSYEKIKKLRQRTLKNTTGLESLSIMLAALEKLTDSFTGSPVRLSTSHLYISSLATQFATDEVPKSWRHYFPRLPQVRCVGVSNYDGARTRIITGSHVKSVTLSENNLHVGAGLANGTVCLWDINTGVKVQTLEGHTECVWSVAFSNDGTRIVSGSSDMTIRIWDTYNGVNLQVLKSHTGNILSVAYSNDGLYIVSGSEDKTVRTWNAITGVNLLTLKGHRGRIWSVALSKDGSHIVSGSEDVSICIWEARTGIKLQTLKGHSGPILSVAFSSDGLHIVSGSLDKTVRIWDTLTGVNLQTLKGQAGFPWSVAFSIDGQCIVSGTSEKTLCIWDAKTGVNSHTLEGHTDWVRSVAYSNDGSYIVSGSSDQTICVWDATPGINLQSLQGHKESVSSVAYSNDGSHIVSGSDDHTVCIWDASTGMILLTLENHTDSVLSVAFSSDGSRVVSGSSDKTVLIWDAISGVLLQALEGHTDGICSVAFSNDASHVVSGSKDCTVRIWNAMTGLNLWTLKGHTDWVRSVAFSKDASQIVSCSDDKAIHIWDANTGINVQTFQGHRDYVRSVAFSNDSLHIVSGSDDWTVRIWDTNIGLNLKTLKGHKNSIRSVQFSNDDSYIVSGSDDMTVRIWDANSGVNIHTFGGHTDYVYSTAFSYGGSHVASGSKDKTLRIWDVSSGA